jgi:hypothetical protein
MSLRTRARSKECRQAVVWRYEENYSHTMRQYAAGEDSGGCTPFMRRVAVLGTLLRRRACSELFRRDDDMRVRKKCSRHDTDATTASGQRHGQSQQPVSGQRAKYVQSLVLNSLSTEPCDVWMDASIATIRLPHFDRTASQRGSFSNRQHGLRTKYRGYW